MTRCTYLMVLILSLILFSFTAKTFNTENFESECPDDCDCHYFNINWVTDCSESNLKEIPYDELGTNVYFLDMKGNNITALQQFPRYLRMKKLQMAHNLLTNIKRKSFEWLEYLVDVDLSENQINSIEADSFVDCPRLLSLELHGNPLKQVNGPFLVSQSLQYLDISSCVLTNLSPKFFVNLTALRILDLSNNPLVYLEPDTFAPLKCLETLILNNCDLKKIHKLAFSNIKHLKKLELTGNKLNDIKWPLVLEQLHQLEYLNLKDSKLTSISEESFVSTIKIRTLILSENELTDLDIAVTLGNNLPHLDTLDLSNCHLKIFMSDKAFLNLTKLKILHLSGNFLKTEDLRIILEPLLSLQKLFLRNCTLNQLPDTFSKLRLLEELDISHNPLENAFTNLLAPLEKLEYLNMGYSNLSFVGSDTFSKLTSMKRLVLSGNKMKSLEAGLFGNLKQLESLELNDCGLQKPIDASLFDNNMTYYNLKELQLAGNPLLIERDIPIFSKHLSMLKVLDMSRCNISVLPVDAFKISDMVKILNLSGNQISSKPKVFKFLHLLPNLEKLDLRYNSLTSILPRVFVKNPKISSLHLAGNPWKCDCSVAEMWDWATLVLGDLSVLVGAKSSMEDFNLKSAKTKESLHCYYEDEQIREFPTISRKVVGRRPFVKLNREIPSANRTWVKYVRESGCESIMHTLKPVQMSTLPVAYQPTWLLVGLGSVIIVMGAMIFYLEYKRQKHRLNDSAEHDTQTF